MNYDWGTERRCIYGCGIIQRRSVGILIRRHGSIIGLELKLLVSACCDKYHSENFRDAFADIWLSLR
jgi:hypothetical protein